MDENLLNGLTKEELVEKIVGLEKQVLHLKNELAYHEQANFEWSGNLGKWEWNVKENKVQFNARKVQALGYQLEDIQGEVGFEFFTSKIHPDDYERVMQNMRDHLYGVSGAYECEYRIQCRDGEWKWFYDRGIIIKRDAENRPLELVGIVFDISEQKKTQLEMENKNAQLMQLNENKNLMLSIIAHDLRSPLGAMDGLMSEIKDVSTLAGQTALLNDFASSVHNMYSLVNNLLEWAVFQNDVFGPDFRELSVYEVSQLAIKHLKLNADNKNIRIINNINPETRSVFDEKMIMTVFRNLVSNAIKFTPCYGQIELSDRVHDGKAEITIRDNGVGISPEIVADIFSISKTKTSKGTDGEKGTGLGLVLCRDFVEKNGGTISVKSEPGKGSAFTFSLPLSESQFQGIF